MACAVAAAIALAGCGGSSHPGSDGPATTPKTPGGPTTTVPKGRPPQQLLASDGKAGDNLGGAQAYDTFSTPIKPVYYATPGEAAMSSAGAVAAIGAPGNAAGAKTGSGAVYVDAGSAGHWAQTAKLVAADGAKYDALGWSVAISGDGHTIVAGAPFGDVGAAADEGTAYVFSDSGGRWAQVAKLRGPDSAAYDGFGWSVAISRDGARIVVGATGHDVLAVKDAGSAYVFNRGASATQWTAARTLIARTPTASAEFGGATALSANGSIAAVTELTHFDSQHTLHSGSTSVFGTHDAWKTAQTRAVFADPNRNKNGDTDAYGVNATFSDDGRVLAIAAPDVNVGAAKGAGATYVYRTTGDWSAPAQNTTLTLLPTNAAPFLYYGSSVALSADGSELVIGVDGAGVDDQGAAELVHLVPGQQPTAADRVTIAAPNSTKGRFGTAIAMDGDAHTAVGTSPWLKVGSADQRGAAYVIDLSATRA
ncbi:MAG TPA: FG-GAP repeat protein [Acidimicrobiia bacterium]|nr:FG-GAP repeat protein [Acidimicrobiia bacterium]